MIDLDLPTRTVKALPKKPAPIAYVRKMTEYEDVVYGIYDENGQALAIAPSRELAFISIRQHDLEPVDVH